MTPLAPVEPIAPATPARPAAPESSFDDHLQRAGTPPKAAEKDRPPARESDAARPAENESRPAESAAAKPTNQQKEGAETNTSAPQPEEPALEAATAEPAEAEAAVLEAALATAPPPPPAAKAPQAHDRLIEAPEKTGLEKSTRRQQALGKAERKESAGARGPAPSESNRAGMAQEKSTSAAPARDSEKPAAEDTVAVKAADSPTVGDEPVAVGPADQGEPSDRARSPEAASGHAAAKSTPVDASANTDIAAPEPMPPAADPASVPASGSAATTATSSEHSGEDGSRRESAPRRTREAAPVAGNAPASQGEQTPAAPAAEPSATASAPELKRKADTADKPTPTVGAADGSAAQGQEEGASRGDSLGRAETGERLARTTESGTSRGADGRPVDGSNLSDADRVRFVQRVARAFHHVSETGGEVRLRLSPPELGAVRIEVAVRDGVLTARLEAETPAARSLLFDNLPALRERLTQQDMRIERFDVELLDRQTAGHEQSGQGAASPDREQQRGSSRGLRRPGPAPLAAAPASAAREVEAGRLNIVI